MKDPDTFPPSLHSNTAAAGLRPTKRQLTLPVVGQIHALAVGGRPVVGTYLQDAGQRADPLLHVLLTLRGQHEVGDLVHLQLKGVFPQPVVLQGGREGAKTDLFNTSWGEKDSLHTMTILS